MTSNRAVVAGVAILAVVALVDALRSEPPPTSRAQPARRGYLIDLESSRPGADVPRAWLRRAFPGADPATLAVSKVAVAPNDEVVAVAVSHVPGGGRRARAAIELWNGDRVVRSFAVAPGSFSLGLWFADEGRALATIGWNERGYVYDRSGHTLPQDAYFAYETG